MRRGLPGAQRVLEYELRLDREVYIDLPLTGLCVYPRSVAPPQMIQALAAGAHHQYVSPDGDREPPPYELPLAVRPAEGGVRLDGHADFDTRAALSAVLDALPGLQGRTVHLDLSGTDFTDLDALARLAATATALDHQGRRLSVRNPHPPCCEQRNCSPTSAAFWR
ncbi:STAS domain-containing protein [Streptacidiphilus sp. PAMC 29251]